MEYQRRTEDKDQDAFSLLIKHLARKLAGGTAVFCHGNPMARRPWGINRAGLRRLVSCGYRPQNTPNARTACKIAGDGSGGLEGVAP